MLSVIAVLSFTTLYLLALTCVLVKNKCFFKLRNQIILGTSVVIIALQLAAAVTAATHSSGDGCYSDPLAWALAAQEDSFMDIIYCIVLFRMLIVYTKLNEHQPRRRVRFAKCFARFETLTIFTIFMLLTLTIWVEYAAFGPDGEGHSRSESAVVLLVSVIKVLFDLMVFFIFTILGLQFNAEILER